MDTVCPLCNLPKRAEHSVCIYCHDAGKRVVTRRPRWYRTANRLSLVVAVLVVTGGFWKVFVAPVRASRKAERKVASKKRLSPEQEANCATMLESYQRASYDAFHVQAGEGRVTGRIQVMNRLRSTMRKMGCPNAP